MSDFVSDKALALLCFLAVNKGFQARQTLASLLWGELPEKRARANLRVALHNLRQLLPAYLNVNRNRVAFHHAQPHWLDVIAFKELAGQNDDPTALARAVELYQGEFLAELAVLGESAFEAWLQVERERLRIRLLKALEHLADHYARSGRWAKAEKTVRRLLALEPWREESYRQLMELLARQGLYGVALAEYERCREVLQAELGVEPMPDTEELYQRLRRLRVQARPNLPACPARLFGREQELAQISAMLSADETRLITLVGLGGAGKTRLALETAVQQKPRFLDGVYWIPLANLSAPEFIDSAIWSALPIQNHVDNRTRPQLLRYLQNKEMLLVLDNFEHLLPGLEVLDAILSTAPHVKLLVTSRTTLGSRWESRLPIFGLPWPQSGADDQWEESGSVKLFLEAVRRRLPGFVPTQNERASILRLCSLLQGVPLGLELAAAWTDTLSLSQIADETEKNLDFLVAPAPEFSDRHNSLQAVLTASWGRLSTREQKALTALSVFQEDFTVEAAQTIANVDMAVLASLIRHSLLYFDRQTRKYQLNQLVKRFVTAKYKP